VALDQNSTLVVSDDLVIRRANADFHLSIGPRRFPCGRYALPILDAFSRPTTLARALDELSGHAKGASAWVELVAQVKGLHDLGALVRPGSARAPRRSHGKRFDSAPVHIRMLDDVDRTSSFQAALRSTVTPQDVVLDIGTGTGVLAVTAALAGARHVYAVEATAMARAAERLAEANGVGDRVTVVDGHSFDVDLPERATVLVSEIIGDDPLGERIVPTFADARARLLAPGARIIPAGIRICALPLEVPPLVLEAWRFTGSRAAVWRERYGIDFDSFVSLTAEHDHRAHVNSYDVRRWKRLAEAVLLADLDLRFAEEGTIERLLPVGILAEGSLSALLVYFEADLGGEVRLQLHPDQATTSNSWGNLLYVLARPLQVEAGQALRLEYRFDGGGSVFQLHA
jgi:hypothetical protein